VVGSSIGGINFTGDMLAIWMTIMMCGVMVVYRKWPDTPVALPTALSSLLLLPFACLAGQPFRVSTLEISVLLGFGLIFTVASVTLLEGSRRIPAAQTALLSALETPLAPVWAFVLLAQVPLLTTIGGGIIILVAVLWSQLPSHRGK
jgi:drug/metabolite transporter (DMT)-like permease